MKRSTLTGIGLSVASVVLPGSVAFERPAFAQESGSSSNSSTSIRLSAPAAEQRIRNREQDVADLQARLKKAEQEYDAAKKSSTELEHVLHALTQRAETSKASLSKAASHLDE